MQAVNVGCLHSLRIQDQIRAIVERVKPELVITTHEGYAWERMVYFGARSAKPDIQCVGYTHAPIFQYQHALKRPLAKNYNPDYTLTSGAIQKKQLERTHSLKNISIDVLGSKRVNLKPLRELNTMSWVKKVIEAENACLVIPEGNEFEINLLFKFSMRCAKKFPNLNFIWRLHPLYSFKKLAGIDKFYNSIPITIELSSRTLEEDFGRCKWVLYRGSSAVIQALMAGLKPIYLHRKGEIKIDPLYEINDWREEVETKSELAAIMNVQVEFNDSFKEAYKYTQKIYEPFNHQPLTRLLKKNANHV